MVYNLFVRADRLISILLILRVHKRLTAREIADRLECSERTILRDMQALTLAGVPVTADRGTGGGLYLSEPYETHLTGLNRAEVDALFVESQSGRVLRDLGLNHAFEGALIKLMSALPALSRNEADKARRRIHIDAEGWQKFEENLPHLSTLQQAIWQEKRVRLLYLRGDGELVERLCDPLGLVAKGRVWYFVGAVNSEIRAYRVSRVRDACILDEAAVTPPRDFDLATYWTKSQKEMRFSFPRYLALVRVSPTVITAFRKASNVRVEEEQGTDANGWLLLYVNFEAELHALEHAMRFAPHLEVLAPLELREQVRLQADQVVHLYSLPTNYEPLDRSLGPSGHRESPPRL